MHRLSIVRLSALPARGALWRWGAAIVLAGSALAVSPLDAQRRGDRVTVRSGTALRNAPGGEVVAVSSREVTAPVDAAQGDGVRVTIRGSVPVSSIRFQADRRRAEVVPANGVSLRGESGDVVNLRKGTYLFPDGPARFAAASAGRVDVRRVFWVDKTRLAERAASATAARAATPTPRSDTGGDTSARARDSMSRPAAPAPRDTAVLVNIAPVPVGTNAAGGTAGPTLETSGAVQLRTGPDGEVLAMVPGGVGLTPLARANGWTRVRIEGWLPDTAVTSAGSQTASATTAADLRADPLGTRGRLVRWSVEILALQTADALRRGLAEGETYLLARGPGAERAILYLAVPDSLATAAQGIPALSEVTITARVRTGRSEPAGVPILDLLELVRR